MKKPEKQLNGMEKLQRDMRRFIGKLLISSFLIGTIFLTYYFYSLGEKEMLDFIESIAASVIASFVLITGSYFMFLRKIPEQTEKKINELLNARLGHEATNHNALKDDHTKIQLSLSEQSNEVKNSAQSILSKMELKEEKEKAVYDTLKNNHKVFVDSTKNIEKYGYLYEQMYADYHKIEQQYAPLKQQYEQLKQQYEKLQQNHQALTLEHQEEQSQTQVMS